MRVNWDAHERHNRPLALPGRSGLVPGAQTASSADDRRSNSFVSLGVFDTVHDMIHETPLLELSGGARPAYALIAISVTLELEFLGRWVALS